MHRRAQSHPPPIVRQTFRLGLFRILWAPSEPPFSTHVANSFPLFSLLACRTALYGLKRLSSSHFQSRAPPAAIAFFVPGSDAARSRISSVGPNPSLLSPLGET